jgi:hypothetical protein
MNMAETKNGTPTAQPQAAAQQGIVGRVVLSSKDAPVTETALVLSDETLAQLVILAPLPPAA